MITKHERDIVIEYDVEQWSKEQTATFGLRDLFDVLQLPSMADRQTAINALDKLCKAGVLEADASRPNRWSYVCDDREVIDWQHADPDNYVRLLWPLSLEAKTRIFHGNIIVIGGVTGQGKTSYIIDLIHRNMDSFKIDLWETDLGEPDTAYKIDKWGYPRDFWKFNMWRWRGNLRLIDPDAITIIDYLQAPDRIWEIGRLISSIKSRILNGVGIICLQRSPDAPFSEGGKYAYRDAQLALNLSFGKCVIAKNRFAEADPDPQADTITYDLVRGEFHPTSSWHKEVKEDNDGRGKGYRP